MRTIAFRLETGDKNYGEVYLPDTFTGRLPVLIYCHGGGMGCCGDLGGYSAAARDYAVAHGIAFATFDCFAGGKTGGDYGRMTYGRWADNLIGVMDWLAARDYVNAQRIGALGISCGSTTALRAAAKGAALYCVSSVASCITVHIGMWGQGGAAKCFVDNLDALLAGERRMLFGVDFEKDFFLDDISNAPVHALLENQVACPVLFQQGAADNVFRCADARLAYDIMHRAGLPAQYIEYPGGAHGLENVADAATRDLFAWLKEINFV